MTREELQKRAEEEARKRGIDPGLARALIEKESAWDPNATSKAGAQGLMQLMPGTAKDLGVNDPLNPEENLRGGLDYLKQLSDEFKTPELALAAYNSGPGNVRKSGGMPNFPETQEYVPSVLAKAKEYGFNPEAAQADQKLLKPDFASAIKADAREEGIIAPEEKKKQSWLGRIFGTSRGEETVDQFGNKKPGEFKEGIGRKILSFAAPLLFGAFPNPFMAALNVSLNNKRGEDFGRASEEDKAYQDTLDNSRKLATPSEDLRKFEEWKKLSPEDRAQYKEMKESSVNPFSLMNMDYRKQRDVLEDTRKSESDRKSSDLKLRDDEASFRKEFEGSPVVKEFNLANTGIKKIREALKAPEQTGFNDQSLIFNYMKVLDPGSVVREGEYATAQKNASLLEAMGVKVNKVMSGEQLSPDQRRKLSQAAETQFKGNQSTYQNYKNQKTEIAKRSGLDPDKVVTNFEEEPLPANLDLTKFSQEDQEAIKAALKEPDNPKAQMVLKHFRVGG